MNGEKILECIALGKMAQLQIILTRISEELDCVKVSIHNFKEVFPTEYQLYLSNNETDEFSGYIIPTQENIDNYKELVFYETQKFLLEDNQHDYTEEIHHLTKEFKVANA